MPPIPVYNEATKTDAVDGEVTLDGPDGVGLSMTPEAAQTTAKRLLEAAARARRQAAERRGGAPAPPIAHGQRVAEEGHMVDDPDQVGRVEFRQAIDHPVSRQEETGSRRKHVEAKPPIGDFGEVRAEPDVWEALPDDQPPTERR